jgi:hypothetical protein
LWAWSAFRKVSFLHALAPTQKEPPLLVAQLLVLVFFVFVALIALRASARTIRSVV